MRFGGRSFRRAAALLAAGVLVAGCGGGAGGDASTAEGGKTVSLWHYYGPPDSATGAALVRLVERYEKEHPGVDIQPRHIPFGDFTRTLLQSAAGGDLPDIALINAFHTEAMVEAGVIQELDDRVAAWGKKDGFFPASWRTTQVGGKTYGLPHLADAYAVYYNTKMLDKAGVEPPRTWDEMAEAAKKLATGGRQGLAVSGIEGDEGATGLIIRILAAGGDVADVDSPEANEALTQFKEMVDDGAMSKGMLGWNEEDVKNQFANEQTAMMINSATYVSTLRTEKPDLEWKVALLPEDEQRLTLLGAENLTITAGSRDPDAAWDVMTWMQRPEVLAEYLPDRNKLPARLDVPAGQDETRAVFQEQLKSAWVPEGKLAGAAGEVFTHIQGALQAAVSGSASVADALTQAQQKIDKALAG
ncbi:multiple sugar transport system substrate-binding protein [Thermocatellispora tengchongensis]|uniref:Multiple sugar transport system substrate-binding protein n=1 Tax=Thermocatellispora tengchongensis TaxID=1073253 RepID=A0A840NWZ6_9ACTN|nr:ABC transporter substrate-binding protein [Thermocatellispora tengchongensis]MBB5131732.1 multiple sugar transport system substrate-binding protein [Thermocatellispora tengchongensis]